MLEKINQRLKAGKVGVSVEQRGDRLCLVATLPPKPGSGRIRPYQQRMALGIKANPAGFKQAELEAKRLGVQLAEGSFTWEPAPEILTTDAAIAKFERDYFSSRERNGKSETTFNNYLTQLKKLPKGVKLTPELMIRTIEATPNNTRTRAVIASSMKMLGQSVGIDLDISELRGNHTASRVNPRKIPTDAEIQKTVELITSPAWRWVYGMMATFGLRNHEVFFVDGDRLKTEGICEVLEGKTTGGKVWPLYPEWLDFFDLRNVIIPGITADNHQKFGHSVNKAFYRYKIPFSPYCLRHAWARRAIEMGLDSRLSAKQMRHSHSVHVKIYNAWLDDSVHQRAFERMIKNKNRPKPPGE